MKLIKDAVDGDFGSRHALEELNYSDNHENLRLRASGRTMMSGQLDAQKGMVAPASPNTSSTAGLPPTRPIPT